MNPAHQEESQEWKSGISSALRAIRDRFDRLLGGPIEEIEEEVDVHVEYDAHEAPSTVRSVVRLEEASPSSKVRDRQSGTPDLSAAVMHPEAYHQPIGPNEWNGENTLVTPVGNLPAPSSIPEIKVVQPKWPSPPEGVAPKDDVFNYFGA